jgi:hypothetical protein
VSDRGEIVVVGDARRDVTFGPGVTRAASGSWDDTNGGGDMLGTRHAKAHNRSHGQPWSSTPLPTSPFAPVRISAPTAAQAVQSAAETGRVSGESVGAH